MNDYFPEVVQAVPGEDRFIYAYFSDGSIHKYDMQPAIDRGGVFDALKDDSFFREKITVLNETVAWDVSGHYDPATCIDIDPFALYESEIVRDPLEESA